MAETPDVGCHGLQACPDTPRGSFAPGEMDGLLMQTADKATLEIFKAGDEGGSTPDLAQEIVRRAVIPAAEVGGDSRLQMPPPNRIQTEQLEHARQVMPLSACFPAHKKLNLAYHPVSPEHGLCLFLLNHIQ